MQDSSSTKSEKGDLVPVTELAEGARFRYEGIVYVIPLEAPPEDELLIDQFLGTIPATEENSGQHVHVTLATQVELL